MSVKKSTESDARAYTCNLKSITVPKRDLVEIEVKAQLSPGYEDQSLKTRKLHFRATENLAPKGRNL